MTHFIHSSASGFSHSIPQQFAILTAATNIAFLFCHLVQHTQNIVSQTVQIRLDEICLNHEAQAKITKLLHRHRIAKPFAFEKFLALEQHRNPGSRENHHSSHRGALLGIPARGIVWTDLLGHSSLTIGNVIVRLAIDNTLECYSKSDLDPERQ